MKVKNIVMASAFALLFFSCATFSDIVDIFLTDDTSTVVVEEDDSPQVAKENEEPIHRVVPSDIVRTPPANNSNQSTSQKPADASKPSNQNNAASNKPAEAKKPEAETKPAAKPKEEKPAAVKNPEQAKASEYPYFTDEELETLNELNFARTRPKEYVKERLQPLVAEATGEYRTYLLECIDEMNAITTPLCALKGHKGYSDVARYWVNVQGPTGETGHDPKLFDRMKAVLKYKTAGENISYGYPDGKRIVIQLLIDSGITSRGHRKNILNGNFEYVGIAIGQHSRYRYMCVQDFMTPCPACR